MFQRILKCDYEFMSPWWDEVSVNAKVCPVLCKTALKATLYKVGRTVVPIMQLDCTLFLEVLILDIG